MTNEREMKIIEDSVRIIREKTDFEPEIEIGRASCRERV